MIHAFCVSDNLPLSTKSQNSNPPQFDIFSGSEIMQEVIEYLNKNAKLLIPFAYVAIVTASAFAIEIPGLNIKIEMPSMTYGSIKRDKAVNEIFETYKILSDHKYYRSGPGNIPYAIIGVHENYKLRKGLWQEVTLTTQLLRSYISQMDTIYGYPPYGSKIMDENGKQIGIWYSSKQWTTVVMEKDNGVAIFTPEPPGFRGGQ
jgi:hypothetical protein